MIGFLRAIGAALLFMWALLADAARERRARREQAREQELREAARRLYGEEDPASDA